jgi:hypothetical protein
MWWLFLWVKGNQGWGGHVERSSLAWLISKTWCSFRVKKGRIFFFSIYVYL